MRYIVSLFALLPMIAAAEDSACPGLRKQLKQVEAEQRQPQSGQRMDWLNAEKRRLSFEMQKRRCSSF